MVCFDWTNLGSAKALWLLAERRWCGPTVLLAPTVKAMACALWQEIIESHRPCLFEKLVTCWMSCFFFFPISWWFEIVHVFICIWISWGTSSVALEKDLMGFGNPATSPRSPVDPYQGLGCDRERFPDDMRSLGFIVSSINQDLIFREGLVKKRGGFRPNNMLLFAGKRLEGLASQITDAKLCLWILGCVPLNNYTSKKCQGFRILLATLYKEVNTIFDVHSIASHTSITSCTTWDE